MDSEPEAHKFCIIIGAGAGGLIQAAELLRKKVLQLQDIQILERNGDYGGVWKAATYPGAACDVFSCTYQVSWHRNPDWNYLFPTASELVQYYRNFAKYFNITDCTTFNQSVTQATWYIQAQAKSVKVFCRSMTYCHPFNNFKYPTLVKWIFRCVPGVLALYAFLVANLFAIWAYFAFRPESWIAKNTERYCRRHLKKQVSDPILLQQLTPTGRFGSKRPLVSLSGFFETLQKDNVELISNPIIAVDDAGIITKPPHTSDVVLQIDEPEVDGHSSTASQTKEQHSHIEADIIIWGTGFKMQGWGGAVPTIGRNGQLLSEHWRDSPNALYGTMTSAFPNLIFVNGPNTTTPWGSLIRGLEMHAAFNRKIIRLIHQKSIGNLCYTLEPRQEMEEAWTTSMQAELNKLATSPEYGPAFYYLNEKGQNTFFFPWTQQYYRWKTRTLKVAEYVESGMAGV